MKLHLVDRDAAVVQAWVGAFGPFPEVSVRQADLLAVAVIRVPSEGDVAA